MFSAHAVCFILSQRRAREQLVQLLDQRERHMGDRVNLTLGPTRGASDAAPARGEARVLILGLFSERYPAIGESHGLSVIAGALEAHLGQRLRELMVIDMVAHGVESCGEILPRIGAFRPNVLGIGLQYGTWSVLQHEYAGLRSCLDDPRLVVFGGPLATYEGDRLLDDVDDTAVVVEGEGDEAFPRVVDAWLHGRSFDGIPNCRWHCGERGERMASPRRLVDPTHVPPPHRGHIGEIAEREAQVFVEASRACSWAACTFCLRGLTDVEGRPREHRRFPLSRLAADLTALATEGVRSFTFADEDFLGGAAGEQDAFVEGLAEVMDRLDRRFSFDVSTTVRSVFRDSDAPEEGRDRAARLRLLREAGLSKVFLGIESGSASQLRRYAKGHLPSECVGAARRVLDSGARLELGFIMFDPLCQLGEVIENVELLQRHGLEGHVSSLTNELRVQGGSRYVAILRRHERELGRRLFDRDVDPDTLTHRCRYLDQDVTEVVRTVRRWNDHLRPLVYPVKNLTRYGATGALGVHAAAARRSLAGFRRAQAQALMLLAQGAGAAATCLLEDGHAALAHDFLEVTSSLRQHRPVHPVLERAATRAQQVATGSSPLPTVAL
jgi:hypothetical protein